jgi:hypothetical protein
MFCLDKLYEVSQTWPWSDSGRELLSPGSLLFSDLTHEINGAGKKEITP